MPPLFRCPQVQPIMRVRGWHVPRLSEFFPANANLLGLNIGGGGGRTREIKVALTLGRKGAHAQCPSQVKGSG